MNKIQKSSTFKLAVLSSAMFILSTMFFEKLFSDYWLIYGFLQFGIFIFFLITFFKTIHFWISKKTIYTKKYIPFIIIICCFIMVIILPLKWIRNRINFYLDYDDYENANSFMRKNSLKENRVVLLPKNYQYLSVGGGEARVNHSSKTRKAFLFYTFRGAPSGFSGFMKLSDGEDIDNYFKGYRNVKIKFLGNNWYYVSAD